MKIQTPKWAGIAALAAVFCLGFAAELTSVGSIAGWAGNYAFAADPGCTNEDCPPDPGCTNEDCPPDPGCTNEDCPPDYTAGCCCYEDYNPETEVVERLCCCKDGRYVSCRLSQVEVENHHINPVDVFLKMGEVPSTEKGLCAPDWFLETFRNPWWPIGEGCGWWKQLHKCGLLPR